MISVDIAHPETDLENLRGVIEQAINKDERDAAYELFNYILGGSDEISDSSIERILESNLNQTPAPDEPDTVDELRSQIEQQRMANQQAVGVDNDMLEALRTVMMYSFKGVNKTKALEAQKRAISNEWDMNLSVPTDNLTD